MPSRGPGYAGRPGRYRGPVPDPVFLITGASGGVGAATASAAAQAGYRVVLAARAVLPHLARPAGTCC